MQLNKVRRLCDLKKIYKQRKNALASVHRTVIKNILSVHVQVEQRINLSQIANGQGIHEY